MDYIWFNSLCYYRNEGFDFVYLVPLTVKVGAVVVSRDIGIKILA